MFYYLIAIIIIALDQISKWAVVNKMELYESIPLISGWLNITSTRNRGAAFSILEDKTLIFIILASLVSIALIYIIYRINKKERLLKFCLALILGGAIGNLIDRIDTGSVVDFIDVRFVDFAIFNVADIAVVVGSILMMIYIIFNKDTDKLFK